MKSLDPADIGPFLKRFRFRDARLGAIRTRYRRGRDPSADLWILARSNPRNLASPVPVRLHLRVERVEEYRLQKRPGIGALSVLAGVQIEYLQGLFFVNLDPWDPGEGRPAVHELRASEAYVAGSELWWEAVESTRDEKPS